MIIVDNNNAAFISVIEPSGLTYRSKPNKETIEVNIEK